MPDLMVEYLTRRTFPLDGRADVYLDAWVNRRQSRTAG
jgi:hypothetical protein